MSEENAAPELTTVETTTTDTPANDHPANDYDALKKAAEDAIDEAEPAKEEPKPAAKMGDKPAGDAGDEDAGLPKIAALFKAREKARETIDKSKHEAEQLLSNARRQAEEDGARIRREATEEAKREVQRQLMRLKSSPLEAIKDIGWDRDQLVNEVAKEGSPEYQMMKRLEARADAAEKKLADYDTRWEQAVKEREEYRVKAQQDNTRQIEKQFLSTITVDSAPSLRKLYDDSEIVQKGHAIAKRLRDETGEDASLEDIRDYLEHQAKERLETALRQPNPGDQKTSATKTKANGQRTLSATSTSERRATPKNIRDMTPDEELRALKEVAEAAMKSA